MPLCTLNVPFTALKFVTPPEGALDEWQNAPINQIAKNHSEVTQLPNVLTLPEGLCVPEHIYATGQSDVTATFSFTTLSLADLRAAAETLGNGWLYILIDATDSFFYWKTAVQIDTDSLEALDGGGSRFSIRKVYRRRVAGAWQYSFTPFEGETN